MYFVLFYYDGVGMVETVSKQNKNKLQQITWEDNRQTTFTF